MDVKLYAQRIVKHLSINIQTPAPDNRIMFKAAILYNYQEQVSFFASKIQFLLLFYLCFIFVTFRLKFVNMADLKP